MEAAKIIGERLKVARKAYSSNGKKGLSKSAFANLLSVHRTTITRWEEGETEIPFSKLEAASNVLALPLKYFIA